jgi:hypothetical protein
MLAILLGPTAFSPPACVGSAPRGSTARMSSDDELAARQAWLNRMEQGTAGMPAERQSEAERNAAQQSEREEARKRMLAAMGGSSAALRSGAGVAFGFGAEDDEHYGYGPQRRYEEEMQEIDLVSGKPVHDMSQVRGTGFDGRVDGWGRKVDVTNPNPPPVANTLRAPGQAQSVAAQTYLYDQFAPTPEATEMGGSAPEQAAPQDTSKRRAQKNRRYGR